MSKRVLAMALAILAFFIFVGSPFQQAAKAVVGVDDAIIAIIIAALAACGITFVTTGAFNSLNEYVSSLIDEYAIEHNTTGVSLLSGAQTGTNKLGQILINNRLVLFIDTFARWLIAKFGLSNSSSVTPVTTGVYIGNQEVYDRIYGYYSTSGSDFPSYWIWQGNDIYAVPVYRGANQYNGFLLVSFRQFSTTVIELHRTDNGTLTYTSNTYTADYPLSNGLYVARNINGTVVDGHYENVTGFVSVSYYAMPNKTDYPGYVPYDVKPTMIDTYQALILGNGVTWNSTEIDINVDNLNLPIDDDSYESGMGAVIDVGASWGSTYDEVTDDVIPDAFSDSKEGKATITYEDDEVVQEQVVDTQQQSISQNVSDYQSPGLQSVFPFCIPFDIYAFFECLAAEPEAPYIVWRFYIPGICDEEIEIDLAEFDSAARILRTMELLLFIVGLAFVTREKFLRG